ncbi:MAG: endo-1,4-beta-xylanase [Pirellulales bacterium]|nr:endo-1,4-beta-xylanase [Pirellulales bacterium]
MGVMRFLVFPPERLTEAATERVYVSGADLVPWQGRVSYADGVLTVERSISESGSLHVPWSVSGYGELILNTATLIERAQPYVLEVELARGKLNQVRNQLAEWQAIGLAVPSELSERLHAAHERFATAVTAQDDPAAGHGLAEHALSLALEASDLLVRTYTDQALAARRRQASRLPAAFGMQLGAESIDEAKGRRLLAAFSSATVTLPWREIESTEGNYRWDPFDAQIAWCRQHQLPVTGGPLLRLDARGLPDWIYLWEGDFDNLLSIISDYVETAVTRYRGQVESWIFAGRVSAEEMLGLSEEDRLRLVARVLELVRQLDPGAPAILRIDQPWAEYLGRVELDLSPLHFADTLVRSGLGVAEIELELNIGYAPQGTGRRDWLDFSRLFDLWACLGIPLRAVLTCASSDRVDHKATSTARPLAEGPPGGWSPQSQQRLLERLAALLLAKPAVRTISWGAVLDSASHEFPWSGLFDTTGQAKPALASLAALRRVHLQ